MGSAISSEWISGGRGALGRPASWGWIKGRRLETAQRRLECRSGEFTLSTPDRTLARRSTGGETDALPKSRSCFWGIVQLLQKMVGSLPCLRPDTT